MITAILGADDAVIAWASQRLPQTPKDRATAIGISDDGHLIAACIYNQFRRGIRGNPVDVHMTMVAEHPRWAIRSMIGILFRYPFLQLEVPRITVTIGRRNKRSRKLAEGMGFRLEGTHRRAWDGTQDAMSYGMLRSECRWLGEVDGQGKQHGTRAA
jgi:RimJ/RimL family protein N-acetyltransferase